MEQMEKEGGGDGESSGQGQIKTRFVEDLLQNFDIIFREFRPSFKYHREGCWGAGVGGQISF